MTLTYHFEIGNYMEYIKDLSQLRSELNVVYSTHEPKYLQFLAKIKEVNVILVYEGKELSGYIPLYVSNIKRLLKYAILDIPSEVLVKDYENMLHSLYLFIRRKYSITNFTFNYLDTHLSTSSKILSSNRGIRSGFATNIVDSSWHPSSGIRRNLKKAEKNNLQVVTKPSESNVHEFYEKCIISTRARKGIHKYDPNEYYALSRFYNELIEASIGKLILIADETGTVVGGSFIVYNCFVCTYYNAGSSPSGLKMGASYLSVYHGIKFAAERGIEYDLFGSYVNKDENYKKLYEFKSQWGKKIALDQYYIASNLFTSFLIQRKLNSNS